MSANLGYAPGVTGLFVLRITLLRLTYVQQALGLAPCSFAWRYVLKGRLPPVQIDLYLVYCHF